MTTRKLKFSHNIMNLSKRFKWAEVDLSLKDFVHKFRYQLPVLIKTTTGYSGYDGGLHEIGSDELFWVFDIQEQLRMIAKVKENSYVSIPIDYLNKIRKIDDDFNACKNLMSFKEFSEDYTEGQRFMFERSRIPSFDFTKSSPTGSKERVSLEVLEAVDQYEEKYLLAHSVLEDRVQEGVVGIPVYMPINVDFAEGFKNESPEEYSKFVDKLSCMHAEQKQKRISPCLDLLLFDKLPMGDYEYITPEMFMKTEDANTKICRLFPAIKGVTIPESDSDSDYEKPIDFMSAVFSKSIIRPPTIAQEYTTDYRTVVTFENESDSENLKLKDIIDVKKGLEHTSCDNIFEESAPEFKRCEIGRTLIKMPSYDKEDEDNIIRTKSNYRGGSVDCLISSISKKDKPIIPPKNPIVRTRSRSTRDFYPLPQLSAEEFGESARDESIYLSMSGEGLAKLLPPVLSCIQDVPRDISSFSVAEVCRCLELLNMSQYIDKFKEATIDGDLLLALNEEILRKDLHVTSLHARRLMMFVKEGWRPRIN